MSAPELSVVIPTLGRPLLIRTIESLLAARGMERAEIRVVGRVADPAVRERLETLLTEHPGRVGHEDITFAEGDSSRKKNAGMGRSKAEIVAFLDDDVTVAPDWPERMLATFEDTGAAMVSGPSLVPEEVGPFARLAGYAMASWATGYAAARYRRSTCEAYPVDWDRIIGCNMAFRRGVLAAAGGFDPRFFPGEELLAAYGVEQAGHRILFDPRAYVYHYPRQDLRGFIRQIWSYGATRTRLRRSGIKMSPVVLLPAIWVAVLPLAALAAVWWPPARALLAVLLAAYGVLALASTLRSWVLTRDALSLGLLGVIPLMHGAYGLGQWAEGLRPGRDLGRHPGETA